jgi:CTP synthase
VKTKPTQHSVKDLRSIGIQPDVLICRSDRNIPANEKSKIALFTNVEDKAVISMPDVNSIYRIPSLLKSQGLDQLITRRFHIDCPEADLSDWEQVLYEESNPVSDVTIGMVGKYVELPDAYKSVNEALKHAGLKNRVTVNIKYIDSQEAEAKGIEIFEGLDAILVPGGFGERGTKGKMMAAQYARENKMPYLGICLGMQMALIEFARNVAKLDDANSTEFDAETPHPVVGLITEWQTGEGEVEERTENSDLGGTMRLGSQLCHLLAGSKAAETYGATEIHERHRHRYEVNNTLVPKLEAEGMTISGWSRGQGLVEMVELADHPWFVACQFHPEFTSRPRGGHPLFSSFINAAVEVKH